MQKKKNREMERICYKDYSRLSIALYERIYPVKNTTGSFFGLSGDDVTDAIGNILK